MVCGGVGHAENLMEACLDVHIVCPKYRFSGHAEALRYAS
jgi:hypothetical protein